MNRRRHFLLLLPLLLFQLVGCAKTWQDAYNVELDEDERFVFGTANIELSYPEYLKPYGHYCELWFDDAIYRLDDTQLVILSTSSEKPLELQSIMCVVKHGISSDSIFSYKLRGMEWPQSSRALYLGNIKIHWNLKAKPEDPMEVPQGSGLFGLTLLTLDTLFKAPGWIKHGYPDGDGYLDYFIASRRQETLERIPLQLRKSIIARGVVDGVSDGADAGEETSEELSPPAPLP